MEKISRLFKKYREQISYVFFGALTTAVNFIVYALFADLCRIDEFLAQIAAWAASVLFAFVTNKLFVFLSTDTHGRALLFEFASFVGARVLSGIIENGGFYLFVKALSYNDYVVKLALSVFIVLFNYVLSKFLIFKKR